MYTVLKENLAFVFTTCLALYTLLRVLNIHILLYIQYGKFFGKIRSFNDIKALYKHLLQQQKI